MIVPYDPDFDHAQRDFDKPPHRSWNEVFVTLGPTRAFTVGLILSFLLMGTVGFLFLLFP